MAVTIKTYIYNGEPSVINKTLGSPLATKTGYFREPFNAISPVFTIDDVATQSQLSTLYDLNFNYIYVVDLNRYYFVAD